MRSKRCRGCVAVAAYFVFPDYLALGAQILATIIFALSLDLVLGYAGIVTLGHAAFFGIGAYTAGILAANGWGEPLTGLIAAALAGGRGRARLRRHHPAHLRPHAADADAGGRRDALRDSPTRPAAITGGADGLQGMEVWPIFGAFRFDLFGQTAYLYCLAVLFVCWLVVRAIVHSPFGRSLTGIRENVAAHARDRRAGRPPQAHRLHDLGGARRHLRRADRADDAVRRTRRARASSAPAPS